MTSGDRTPAGSPRPHARWLGLIVSLAAVALLWSPILRNDRTPAGDGDRIMKFIAFARHVGVFAFWNPYRNGGYPLTADAEHFWLLSLVIDPASPYANLMLNAAIFALILLSIVPAWLIGRRLGLRPFWNVLFVVALGFNEQLIWVQLSGRIAALMYHATLLVVFWNLLYRRLRPWNYVVISVAIGVAFAVSAHFALVHCALVLSALLFNGGVPWRQPLRRSLSALGRAALVSLAGLGLSGVSSVPLVGHFAESRRITSALAYLPGAPDDLLAYARLFVPFVPADIEYASFLSLTVVPALLLARWARPAKIAPGGLGFDLIYAWGALFVLMSLPLIGPVVKTLYQQLPLVSGVRGFSPLEDVLRTALVVNAFVIFQALERRRVKDLDRTTRFFVGAYLGFASAFAALQSIKGEEPITAAAAVATAAFATYGLISSAGFRIAVFERMTVAWLGAAFVIISSAMTASEISWQHYYPGAKRPTHVTNQRDMPRLETIVRSDSDPYYRFIADTPSLLWFLDDERRGTVAFSLYFPPSLARTLSYLSPRHDLSYLRPHWVPLVLCSDFDPRALDLLAVKYMFCRLDAGEPRLPPNWQALDREQDEELFRNSAYDGGLRIFCNWRIGGPTWERGDVLSAFSAGVALLEPAPVRALPTPSSDCAGSPRAGRDVVVVEDRPGHMTLNVRSATPGIVFVPDNYDSGWRATVNGLATPVIKVYGAYLGLPIAAGESAVTMEYWDDYFGLGGVLSVLAALGLCGYAIFARREIGCNGSCGSGHEFAKSGRAP